jgi:hypothetical protein
MVPVAESRRISGPFVSLLLVALATAGGGMAAACGGLHEDAGQPARKASVEVSASIETAPCWVRAFPEAEHSIGNGDLQSLKMEPASCVDALIQRLAHDPNVLIVVIGHVDKRELRRPKARIYGNSISLGYQRALAVRSALLNKYQVAVPRDTRNDPPSLEGRILAIATGAASIGERVNDAELEEDRAVEIRPYWFVAKATLVQSGQDSDIRPTGFGTGDKLTLLTLIVALSAYLASVRLVAIGRLVDLKGRVSTDFFDKRLNTPANADVERRSNDIKVGLKLLTLADAPMIVSGLLLGLHIFYGLPDASLRWSIYFFTFGGLALVGLHAHAWKRTFWST